MVFFAPAGSLARAVAIGLVAAAVGFGLIAWRTASLAAPTLSRPLFNINVEGRIADIQRLPEGVRVVLEAVRLKGNGAPPVEMTPVRLRVSLSKRGRRPCMSATASWCWPISRRPPARRLPAPSISSVSPGTSSLAPWAMRWRLRR